MSAPDPPLFSGPIQGVRAWEVVESERDGPLLAAWALNQVWPPGDVYRAACLSGRLRRPRHRARRPEMPHLAPHPDCACGIYALHPESPQTWWEVLEKLPRCEEGGVIGVVDAWGRIEVHGDGFRAECARPATFYVCRAPGEIDRPRIDRLAAAYGAPVIELQDARDLVMEFEGLRGIGGRTVTNLLRESFELVLEPHHVTRLDRTGRSLKCSGFRPSGKVVPEYEGGPSGSASHLTFTVANVRRGVLQREEFNLCREVLLVKERVGTTRTTRVSVWDASSHVRVGTVPAAMTSAVWRAVADGKARRALVIWQVRDAESGRRESIDVLVTGSERVSLLLGRPPRRVRVEHGESLF